MKQEVYILTALIDSEDGSELSAVRAFKDLSTAKSALRKVYNSEVRRAKMLEMLYDKDISESATSATIYWTDGDTTHLKITPTELN